MGVDVPNRTAGGPETLSGPPASHATSQGVHALRDVTLELRRHEVVGLIGPNGAGKTTLVNVLTGFDFPTAGTVELAGERRHARGAPHRRGRAGLARTFQHSRVVRGAVACARTSRSRRSARAPGRGRRGSRAAALLELLGLAGTREPARRQRSRTATSGKLGVARALATEPRFLLLDEPAAGLPEGEVPEFAAVVRSVRDEHEAGVLLIDHNMALVMEVCDRIQVLDQGRTLAAGNARRDPRQPRRRRRVPRRGAGDQPTDARAGRPRGPLRRRARPCAASRSSVGEGEIVGLIGPNGAGKSTTLHAIMGARPARTRATIRSRARRSAAGRPRSSRARVSRSCPRGGGSTPT